MKKARASAPGLFHHAPAGRGPALTSKLFDHVEHRAGVAVRRRHCLRCGRAHVAEAQLEVAGVGGVGERVFTVDDACAYELFEDAVEGLHAVEFALLHRVGERLALAVAVLHVLARACSGLQDFDGGDAPLAVGARQEPRRDDEAEGLRQSRAYGLLLVLGEDADDSVNGLRGVNGVKGREDEVSRLGGFERDFNRLAVAHLADEYDFGRLAQRRPEGQCEARRVGVKLALVYGRVLVRVKELYRVFDGDDVVRLRLVDEVNDGGERRRLARTRRAGDDDDAVLEAGDLLQDFRQVEVAELRRARRGGAHEEGVRAAPPGNVYAGGGGSRGAGNGGCPAQTFKPPRRPPGGSAF